MATEAVVSVALETLGNLLIQEAAFLRGVSDQVEGLRVEFGRMQSLLKDADRKQHDNKAIRNWMQETRYLAYRAEDVLEEHVVKSRSGNGKGFINILKRFVCFVSEIGTSHKLGSEIGRIKSSITILTGHMNECGIRALITRDEEETNSDENRLRFNRKTYARHKELEHFVGMKDDIKKLVSLLVSDKERCPRVICVWGIGGSGKTSVANKVFKHVDVYRCFELFTWVTITKKCQIRSVMQNILGQLLPEKRIDIKYMTVDELGEQIYNVQLRKKCLTVFDDIWKLDDWKCLSKCFPDVRSHSKVLLTTRHENVAEIGYPIKLKGLTEDEAWKLLRLKAFAKIGFKGLSNGSEYEKLGRKMIRKCGCLPLAVAVLGGILSGKNSLEEWKLASDNIVNSYIVRGEGRGEQGEVEKVLGLSYDELPYHLKPCFLSLGFLRENEGDDVESIYNMWMAEGFIQSEHVGYRETLCDVSKSYMYELQLRSMVRFDHDLRALFLHDSMLDFCRSKAKEEEFLKVVDKHNKNSGRAYRLVGYVDHEDDGLNFLNSAENILPLRSMQIFLSSNIDEISLSKRIILHLPHFKSLTTLIIHYFELRGKCFPGIENLIHLRLLGFISCKWERFSLESIHKLPFLQTLDLSRTRIISSIRKSPPPVDTFCKMPRLRRLYLPFFLSTEFNTERKLRLTNMSQLETLSGFDSRIYDLNDLNIHSPMLRTLRCIVKDTATLVQTVDYIRGSNLTRIYIAIHLFNLDASSEALRKLLRIPSVTLELDIESCKLSKLPRLETIDFSNMCPGLSELNLFRVDIVEDIMQALGKFPNLRILVLWHVRFDGGEKMVCDAGSFPSLKVLSFSVIINVEGKFELRIDEAAMPNLSSLVVLRCSEIYVSVPQRFKLSAHTKVCACERNMSVCLLDA